ncbi:MAG: NAD(P)H-hydrate dehydratase [Thermoguttaceae bacterium]
MSDIYRKMLPTRSPFSHKGDFGFVTVIGGSRGMSGAAALASKAALVTGAGLVRAAVPKSVLGTVASYVPEIMTQPLEEDRSGRISLNAFSEIQKSSEWSDLLAVGPGLGRSLGIDALIAKLYRTVEKPMILDADALFALSQRKNILDSYANDVNRPNFTRILTPHTGEFRRLVDEPVPNEQTEAEKAERITLAKRFAEKMKVILVLKGHETIVTDGKSVYVNNTGNPGMATAGSGDVLTGIIAGLLAQKLSAWEAAKSGVYLHGLAGDSAAEFLGHESLTASRIIDFLPETLKKQKNLNKM